MTGVINSTTRQRKIFTPTTVTQEGLMLSCIINRMYNHGTVTTNITSALLQNDIEGTVQVLLYGILTDMLLNTNTEKYIDKIFIDRGKKVI